MENKKKQLAFNIKAHNKVSKIYDKRHFEIFTDIEQKRLYNKLKFTKSLIKKKKLKP
jgi:hypothetical protein